MSGLYVIDSIVRQSRHQFGADKDVFAQRFAKNIVTTFQHLLQGAPNEKVGVIHICIECKVLIQCAVNR